MKTLIYLHGFASSPKSQKAQSLSAWLQANSDVEYIVPTLPFSVEAAKVILDDLCQSYPDAVFIGSSLGGFYASYVSQKYNRRAVLVNPAVKPYDLIGGLSEEVTSYYTDETYFIQAADVATLHEMDLQITKPDNLAALIETGDETLDFRQALEKYAQCLIWLEQGGSHRCESFERYLPQMREFFKF